MNSRKIALVGVLGLTLAGLTGAFAANKDEIGLEPSYWLTFESGNYKTSSGTGAMNYSSSSGSKNFIEARVGETFRTFALTGGEIWGSLDKTLVRPFTMLATARLQSANEANKVILSLGHKGNNVIGLKSAADYKVSAFYNNSANVTAEITSAQPVGNTDFVNYAIVCKDDAAKTVEFYIEGKLVGSASWDFEMDAPNYQVGGIHGGPRSNADACDNHALDDWRVYEAALTAEQIADIVAAQAIEPALATRRYVDENGYEPTYWFKFNETVINQGAYSLSPNGYQWFCADSHGTDQCACHSTTYFGGVRALPANNFTFVTAIQAMDPGTKRIVWSRGKADGRLFGLWSDGSEMGLFTYYGGSTAATKAELNDPDGNPRLFARFRVPYADVTWNSVAVVYADGVFTVYLNGGKVADSTDGPSIDPTKLLSNSGIQFNNSYGNSIPLSSTAFFGERGARTEDFRYYEQALTAAELAAIAVSTKLPPMDEVGEVPYQWYKFNGNSSSSGLKSMGFDGGTWSYIDAVDGKGLKISSGPWGNAAADLPGAFTFVIAAKTKDAGANRIIWSRGRYNGYLFGLYANGTTVGLFERGWTDGDGKTGVRTFCSAVVPDAMIAWHSYAFTYTPGEEGAAGLFELFVDGEKVADSEGFDVPVVPDDVRQNSYAGTFQFGNASGNSVDGISSCGANIDDFRFYEKVLTPEQLTEIAGTFYDADVFDENGEVPLQWCRFNGNADSFGWVPMTFTGGTYNYMDAADGKALNVSSGPWSKSGAADLPGAFTFVTAAKVKGAGENRIIWSRGHYTGKNFGLYANGTTVGIYENGWGDGGTKLFCQATVDDATTMWHSYAITYTPGEEGAAGLFELYVDGVKKADSSAFAVSVVPADLKDHKDYPNGFQFGNGYGAGISNMSNYGADIDDFRLYDRVLTAKELTAIAQTFMPEYAIPAFTCVSTVDGDSIGGWYGSWEFHPFSSKYTVIGPGSNCLVYRVKGDNAANIHHQPGMTLATKPARSIAFFANIELMEDLDDGKYHAMGHIGGTTQKSSGAAICLARKGDEVMLVYMDGNKKVGESEPIDVTGLTGYHLYVFSYEAGVGTMLTLDGEVTIRDTSDLAKVQPVDGGFQVGALWGGMLADDFAYGNGFAAKNIIGYDVAVGDLEMERLLASYPAEDVVVTSDFNLNRSGVTYECLVPSCTFSDGKYLGATKGTLTVPAGIDIEVPYMKFLNVGYTSDEVVFNLAGKVTTTREGRGYGKNVYSDLTGVLFGHWAGTGTYNITGELDASISYIELAYSAGSQTVNVDGGLVKTKGIWYYKHSGAPKDRVIVVNIMNGGRIETTGTTGFDAALAVLGGENTVVFGETSSSAEPIALTAGSVAFEIADGKTVTRSGAITGTGTLVKTGTGTLVLSGEADATANIRLDEGQILVPAGFAGKVSSGVKGWTAVPSAAEDGMQAYTLKQTGLSIILR